MRIHDAQDLPEGCTGCLTLVAAIVIALTLALTVLYHHRGLI